MGSLRDALAPNDTLARLEARPTTPKNQAAGAAVRIQSEPDAQRVTGDELVAAGFRYVGVRRSGGGYVMRRWDMFIDADETTSAQVRRHQGLLPLSPHYLVTCFEDGTSIETVGRDVPVYGSEGPATVRAGTGDFMRDVEGHFAAVRERVERGVRIVPVRDLETTARIGIYQMTHIISPRIAAVVVRTRTNQRLMALQFAFLVACIVYVLLRRH